MQFEHKKVTIGLPESLYLLRLNKQVGCFSIGSIEAGNVDSITTYGRGKWIEFVIAQCDTDLHGKIGRIGEEKQWAFVSAVVVGAEDKRLPQGLLIHFICYGYEAKDFAMLAADAETAAIFGDSLPQIVRVEFNRSVATQFGSMIRPPSITVRNATKEQLPYFEAAQIISEQYSTYLPNAEQLYPATADPVSGEIVSGLFRQRNKTPVLSGGVSQLLLAD